MLLPLPFGLGASCVFDGADAVRASTSRSLDGRGKLRGGGKEVVKKGVGLGEGPKRQGARVLLLLIRRRRRLDRATSLEWCRFVFCRSVNFRHSYRRPCP